MKTSIVLGLGFGDEGKGKTTAWLASKQKSEETLIIRFSGGQQAGHTVDENGLHHVFSSFGSGTLQGVPTFWSKYCTFYPTGFINERNALLSLGISPDIMIDPMSPVTTPYDVLFNRTDKDTRLHGTVGVGVAPTLKRHESFFKLYFGDLKYDKVLRAKMENIRKYYYNFDESIDDTAIVKSFYEAVKEIRDLKICDFTDSISKYKHVIFEGSQGILLDQNYGFFPNVTKSNTTCKNAIKLIKKFGIKNNKIIDMWYVTRTYQTRHGAGFMINEQPLKLKNAEHETNIYNQYQGNFRIGKLDDELLNYAILCNEREIKLENIVTKNLMITCNDQFEEIFPLYCHFDNVCGSYGQETNNIRSIGA